MNTQRVPAYKDQGFDGMLAWFAEMSLRDLLFHPEDSPREIVNVVDGSRIFTDGECADVERILSDMYSAHGDDVLAACYPIFMRKAGVLAALDS